MTLPYPPFVDPVATEIQQSRYTFWPVAYQNGDPTVISNVPLPLSGVRFSEVMRGVGELRAHLQLADPEVQALYPWDKVIPRITGIVVVRETLDDVSGQWVAIPVQHYIVWAAPPSPATGRIAIFGQTVESLWARRLITKAMTWAAEDQQQIAADLLDPALFSLIPLGSGLFPGWITIDPPTVPTGVLRDWSYAERQETNLLEAHQNRSQLATNSYEWTTKPVVLDGPDAMSANTFRVQYILGFPKLGRQLGDEYPVPRFRFDSTGGGNVSSFDFSYDGSSVVNIVWGRGNGYEELQVKTLVTNTDGGVSEWDLGFLQAEARFSDPDVGETATLESYSYRYMWQQLSNEKFVAKLSVRANRAPFFGSYHIGDEVILESNDSTWPPDLRNDNGYVEFLTRIYGWTVVPPQGVQDDVIELLIAGDTL
jgi:hypothetical protein